MRSLTLSLIFLAALGLAGEVRAVSDSTAPGTVAGDWRLSEVGGRVTCTLTFTHQSSHGGFELKAPLACRRAFPPLEGVVAWTQDDKGGLILSDAQAKPVIVFPEEAGGSYEAKAPDGRTWRLEPLPQGRTPAV